MYSIIISFILIFLTSVVSAQEVPKTAQEVPKTAQETAQDSSKTAQETLSLENTQEALIKQILFMAKLLESRDENVIKNFILTYAMPEEMKKILSDQKIGQIVQQFMKNKQDKMRNVLLHVSTIQPTKNPDGVSYTFQIDQSKMTFFKKKIEFKYSEKKKRFYIKN